MTNRLITQPAVFVFAKTAVDWDGIRLWMEHNGYTNQEHYQTLNRLMTDIMHGEITEIDGLIELCARFCYRAFSKGRLSPEYMHNILESGHGSVLAHASVTFAIQGVSRGLSHELVRHHVGCNPSQESQRYVDAKDIQFVVPPLLEWSWRHDVVGDQMEALFLTEQREKVQSYTEEQTYLRDQLAIMNPFDDEEKLQKRINEAARCELPNCCETRLTWTMNVRAARHVFAMRGANDADLEIRRLAVEMFKLYQPLAPLSFSDFSIVDMPVVPGLTHKFGGV